MRETDAVKLLDSDEIAAGIRTRHIQTPIERVIGFGPDEPRSAVASVLSEGKFDSGPIMRGGDVAGFVLLSDIADRRDHEPVSLNARSITALQLVAGDTSVSALLPALADTPFRFVVEGDSIAGLVTPSDLNKQPGRTYFYLLVAALELTLAERIRAFFLDQERAVELLAADRQRKLRGHFNAQRNDDVQADLVAAMDFADLFAVVRETDDLRREFGAYTPDDWSENVMSPLRALRNDVMHSVKTLSTDAPHSIQRLIQSDQLVRQLLTS